MSQARFIHSDLHQLFVELFNADQFKDAESLIDDFFNEVERMLGERRIGMTVVTVEEIGRSK